VTGGYDIRKATEPRDRWDRGEHLAGTALDDRGHVFVEKVWPAINPVGVIRLQGVPAIRAAAAIFVSTLARIKKLRDAAQMRREFLAAVQSDTSPNVTRSADRTLGEPSSSQIATLDLEAMRRLIEKWSSFLTTPNSADDAYEAVSHVRQAAAGHACNVKIDQICAVAVNNAHCINISVSVSVNQG
jgi:hypothetical protein